MGASDLVNLSFLLDGAKCFALVRQHRWPEGVRCLAVPAAHWFARGVMTPSRIGSDTGAMHAAAASAI